MLVSEAEPPAVTREWGSEPIPARGPPTHLLGGLLDRLHLEHLVGGPLLVIDAVLCHGGGPGGRVVGGWDLHLWGPVSADRPGLRGSQWVRSAGGPGRLSYGGEASSWVCVRDPQRLPSLFLLRRKLFGLWLGR